MNEIFKMVLSLSVSGGLLILLLLAFKKQWRAWASLRWQYYIWLVILVRLLVPFTPGTNLVGGAFQKADEAAAVVSMLTQEDAALSLPEELAEPDEPAENAAVPEAAAAQTARFSLRDALALAGEWLWLVWLAGALVLLVRKIVMYQSFVKYIRAGGEAVAEPALLDRVAVLGGQAGVKRPVELYVNPLVASPMLMGILHPCIVLPSLEVPEQDFDCTVLHEMTHCRRGDMLYKWLVQLALCVHWFNPLVYRMEKEVSRACELSCDERVIRKMDETGRRAYGDTLLHAVAAESGCIRPPASAALHESRDLLKERLDAIRRHKTYSRTALLGGVAAALALLLCACTAGAYRPFAGGTQAIRPMQDYTAAASTTASASGGQHQGGSVTVTDTVRNIQVDWVSGQINFTTHEGDGIFVSETADRALDASSTLYYAMEGRTLHIKFTEKDRYTGDELDGLLKTLTISLPQSMELNGLEVNAAAASVLTRGVRTGELKLNTVAGAITLENTAVREELAINTVAGEITAGYTGAETIKINNVSGSIRMAEDQPAGEIKLVSVSGKVDLTLGAAPASCSVQTQNGSIRFTMPQDMNTGIKTATASGRVTSDFAELRSSDNGRTRIFGGSRDVRVNVGTTTGSITLLAAG